MSTAKPYVLNFNNNLATLLNTLGKLAGSEETSAQIDRMKKRIIASRQITGDEYILQKAAKILINFKDQIMSPRADFVKFCSTYVPPNVEDADQKTEINLLLVLRQEALQKMTDNEVEFIHKLVRKLLKSAIEFALDN